MLDMSAEVDTLYWKLTGTKTVTLFLNVLVVTYYTCYFFISGNNHLSYNDMIVLILTAITFGNTFFVFLIANLLLADALNI